MVSSTTKDLPSHRKAVVDGIWRRGMYPLVMETATATPVDAIKFSLDLVNEAEVYMGVFGFRYGYRPKDPARNPKNLSITELEYRRALERGIPILIFIMADDHPTPVNVGEARTFFEPNEESEAMLNRLKDELKEKYVVGFFKSAQELGGLVYQALTELHEKGLIQYDEAQAAPDQDEAPALPRPPKSYVAHDYILTSRFVGRKVELGLLDDWAASADTTMVVDAIGGIGKSALTWQWFQAHAGDFEGAIWWSFYESDSAVTNFTRHALAYLTGKAVKDYDSTLADERERQLLTLLKQKRYLLLLDGLERVLLAYHRMDAPQVLDEQIEDNAPAHVDHADLRACTDNRHADFLRKLTVCAPTKILISTRLTPSDLEDKSGKLLPGVRQHRLNGLHPHDALELLRHLGVNGEGPAIQQFTAQLDNHSLFLKVLAGRINEYRPAPGDFARWHADEGRSLKLQDLDLKGRRSNILQYALAGLTPKLRKLLSQVAAFRYSVDYETVSTFNPYLPPRPQEVEDPEKEIESYRRMIESEEWDFFKSLNQTRLDELEQALPHDTIKWQTYQRELQAYEASLPEARRNLHVGLSELEDRGLLQWDRVTNRYDLHPVVRAVAFEDMPDDERSSTLTSIRDHF